MRHR
jgi:acyl-CoA dehydrogenase